jgi:hypothetical protein
LKFTTIMCTFFSHRRKLAQSRATQGFRTATGPMGTNQSPGPLALHLL